MSTSRHLFMIGQYKNTSHFPIPPPYSTNRLVNRCGWQGLRGRGYTLLRKSCWTGQPAFKVVWGRGSTLPITEKLKLYAVREAFHIDELRKGDKVKEFRFEIQTSGMFGLSLIMPTIYNTLQVKPANKSVFCCRYLEA
jgi:hypothetical protein